MLFFSYYWSLFPSCKSFITYLLIISSSITCGIPWIWSDLIRTIKKILMMPFLRVSFKYIFCGRNLNLLCVSWFLVPWFSCFLVFLYLGFQIMYFSTSSSPLQTALTTAIRSWIKKSDQRKLRRCVSWKKYEFWSLCENLSWRDASTSKNSLNEF